MKSEKRKKKKRDQLEILRACPLRFKACTFKSCKNIFCPLLNTKEKNILLSQD